MQNISSAPETIYQNSIVNHENNSYFLARLATGEKRLVVAGDATGFYGEPGENGLLCPLSPENATTLRLRLPWLNPIPLGLKPSFGFGDRMGTATPGHIQALRSSEANGRIYPIFAQQSVRENGRTGRTPQQVMDDAMWGMLQAGWQNFWGADADHVKEVAHLAPFVQAGYTFYTIDPSDHVDNAAQTDTADALWHKVAALPWDMLQSSYEEIYGRYCQRPFVLNGLTLTFDETILQRALAKYGRSLAHTLTINQALTAQMGHNHYDLEMSVDETNTPTSVHEHFFIINELIRHAIPVVSLAPRFVGKFQKGVDYIGDLAEFEEDLIRHVAILHHFGSYKLSIHTGSDKFSLYPLIARHAKQLVHVKTAGTSYLEALRVVACYHPALFRRILELACQQFEKNRKTYFLDATLDKVPQSRDLADADLPGLLEQFDARQVLHVAFGSVLDTFGAEFHTFIDQQELAYQNTLETHFVRHLKPFIPGL